MSRIPKSVARRGGAMVAGAAAFALLLTGCANQGGSNGAAPKAPP